MKSVIYGEKWIQIRWWEYGGGGDLLLFFFIEVELIYNVMLVSGIQQSDSVIYVIYIYVLYTYMGLIIL